MRGLPLLVCFMAGCAPAGPPAGPWDLVPDVLEYPWLDCELDPATGEPVNPNCVGHEPAVLHISVLLRAEQIVDVVSDAAGILVVRQDQIVAIPTPPTEEWLESNLDDEVWAERSGVISGEPSASLLGLEADERGPTLAFIVVDDPPRDDAGRAIESIVTLSTASEQHEVTLRPVGGEE